MAITEFYDDPALLDEVDWPLMRERYWADTDDDRDRKRRRQAELLVHERFPVNLVQEIGVMNQRKKAENEALLAEFGRVIQVTTKRDGYY